MLDWAPEDPFLAAEFRYAFGTLWLAGFFELEDVHAIYLDDLWWKLAQLRREVVDRSEP